MALWTPSSSGLVFEHHTIADLATSIRNHATGTDTASVNGSWTGAAGYQDISGTGPKGLDFGFPIPADGGCLAAVVDPNSGMCLLGTSGTNAALAATCRLWLDANPTAGQTITINGQAITFRASGATGFEVNIGATPQATAAAIAALINANGAAFACTAYNGDSGLNAVMELTSTATGTAPNSITVATAATACRFTARNGLTSVGNFGSGAAGEPVTSGIYHSGSNLQGRNSSQGLGGLATIAVPGTAGFYYISCNLRRRDFPQLRIYSGGVLLARAEGTTAGRSREASGNVFSGLTGGGTGNAKMAYAAMWNRPLPDAEDLANYLAVQTALAGVGTTVN